MKDSGGRLAALPWMLSILRMVTGFLFMEHGAQKLVALSSLGPPDVSSPSPRLVASGKSLVTRKAESIVPWRIVK
jgi:hypothetical protein